MTAVTICLPLTQLISIKPMASDTAVWRCRLCCHQAGAGTEERAYGDAVTHLVIDHDATTDDLP